MAANLNLFSQVSTSSEGGLSLSRRSRKGETVTLRFEMDTLVVLHTCPHPLNTDEDYPQTPVEFHLSKAAAIKDDDFCMNYRPENQRGFKNNALYHMGLEGEG